MERLDTLGSNFPPQLGNVPPLEHGQRSNPRELPRKGC